MKRVQLSDVAIFVNGLSFKTSDWSAKGKRIIRIQNLTDANKPFNRTLREVDAKYVVNRGDLLVSWSATLGVFQWHDDEPALLNQHIFKVTPDSNVIDEAYLKHMLKDALDVMQSHLHGATMKHVNRREFLSTQIPLPPLPEQKRIASILDTADAVRRKRAESLETLDELAPSLFHELFGDPVTNPMGWKVEQITKCTTFLDHLRKPIREQDRTHGNVPYYGANGQQGWHNTVMFDEPLVLVAEDGGHFDTPERGVAYRINGPSWVNNHAHVLRPNASLDIEFLHMSLRNYDFSKHITGSTRAKLTKRQLGLVNITLPPSDLQKQFASMVETIEAQKTRLRAHLAEAEALFASLQHRAFAGEL